MITQTYLDNGSSAASASSYATNSITPSSNQLILLSVFSSVASGSPNVPTASGNGLTWDQVATVAVTSAKRLTLFRSLGAQPTTGTITVSFGGQNQNGFVYSISSFDGENFTIGDNGAGAIVQSNTNSNTGVATLSVALSSFANTINGTYGTFAVASNVSITAGSGFTGITSNGLTTPGALQTEWRNDNDTSVDVSWSGNNSVAGIALEIKSAVTDSAPINGNPLEVVTYECIDANDVVGYLGLIARPTIGQVFPAWFE